MVGLFLVFVVAVFFLYRDPKGHDAIHTFSSEHAEVKDSLSVMTYNIGFGAGLGGLLGVTYKKDFVQANLDKMAETILKYNPDILCMQEIDVRSRRSFAINQVEFFAKKCGYPYVAVSYTWNRYYIPFPFTLDVRKHFGKVLAAQATFSKYPIKSNITLALPQVESRPWWYRFFYLNHVTQVVEVEVGDKSVDIVNIHFEAFDKASRKKQAYYLIAELEEVCHDCPLIIAGDFNAVAFKEGPLFFNDEPTVDYGSDHTLSLFTVLPFIDEVSFETPETFPANHPTRTLDYIFYAPKFMDVVESKRCDDAFTASDHLPIYTRFKLHI